MKKTNTLICLVFFSGLISMGSEFFAQNNLVSAQKKSRNHEVSLEVGEQITVSSEGFAKFSVGDKSIIEVRKTSDLGDLIIVGKRAGRTTLLLVAKDGSLTNYKINVRRSRGSSAGTQVNSSENIRLDLYFVQVSDSYSHNIGLAWPTSYPSGDGNVAGNLTTTIDNAGAVSTATSIAVGVQQVLPRLDIAQTRGWAKVYRQVALVTANNTAANFSAGGEVNVAVSAGLTGSLQQVNFGTTLECIPKYDRQTGRMELQIKASVADLTSDRGTGVPGRSTANVESVVNLSLGESIVLGGFIAKSETRDQGGLAGLSQIPIVGALFGTNRSRAEGSEALMFIVPSVIEPVPLTKRNRIQEALQIYQEFSGGTDETDVLEQPRLIRN